MKNTGKVLDSCVTKIASHRLKALKILVPALMTMGACSNPPVFLKPNDEVLPSVAEVKVGDLTRAVLAGDEPRVLALIKAGANVNENVGSGEKPLTPLLAAVASNRPNLIRILLSSQAIDHLTYQGYNASDFLIHLGQDDLARETRGSK